MRNGLERQPTSICDAVLTDEVNSAIDSNVYPRLKLRTSFFSQGQRHVDIRSVPYLGLDMIIHNGQLVACFARYNWVGSYKDAVGVSEIYVRSAVAKAISTMYLDMGLICRQSL